jgi:hypothetical protein
MVTETLDSMMLADWWAFGQMVATLFIGYQLYDEKTDTFRYEPIERLDSPLREVIQNIIKPGVPQEARPSPREIMASISTTLKQRPSKSQ